MVNIIGTTLAVASLVLGASFWSVARAPLHLRRLLLDRNELILILNYLGHMKLVEEARAIKPVLGSYAKNIEGWDIAHSKSLSIPRNLLSVLAAGLFVGSFF